MKKIFRKIFAVVMTAAMMISAAPALATNGIVAEEDFRVVYNLETGESSIVDINSTEEHITFVHVSIEEAEDMEITRARVHAGSIKYEITDPIIGNSECTVQCYQSPTLLSSSGNTVEYSHLWDFVSTERGTMTLYGNLGWTKYTNALVVDKNFYSPANWGIMLGDYALANNFFVANMEYFGASLFYTNIVFTYS